MRCVAHDWSHAIVGPGLPLDGYDLSDARDLNHVSLANASLREADFTNADLHGVDLTGADLHDAIMTAACTDRSTTCPHGEQGPCDW